MFDVITILPVAVVLFRDRMSLSYNTTHSWSRTREARRCYGHTHWQPQNVAIQI